MLHTFLRQGEISYCVYSGPIKNGILKLVRPRKFMSDSSSFVSDLFVSELINSMNRESNSSKI